ncbi:unnamed protein product [Toxocara canis]|uniref:Polyprotein n=1 Tax=Toxocara canis TaxID=6265 RepID=A0A183VDA6_TOXCA|nr:unnamed protein product [Toxocara canis]
MDYETHEESDEESDGITYWRLRSDPNARNHIRREHRGSMLRLKPVSLRSALSIIQPIPVEEGTFWRKLGWSRMHELKKSPFLIEHVFERKIRLEYQCDEGFVSMDEIKIGLIGSYSIADLVVVNAVHLDAQQA